MPDQSTIALILFGGLAVLILLRVPLGFSLAVAGMTAYIVGGDSLLTMAQSYYDSVNSFPLIAVPMFFLAGIVMERGGLSRRLVDVAEAMIKHIIRRVLERCPDEINFFNSFVDKGLKERLTHVMTSDFGRVSYTEAVEILKQHNDQFDFKVDWGTDLQTEHERFLTEQVFKRPVFVTDYPAEIKAFYMRMNDDGKTVAAADCLVPGIGEIIGGSQREERLEVLEERIRQLGMNPEDYWWYCDLRRYGSCKHAGFGLGFERMVMYLTGVSNIRDVELHPRTVGNAEF